MLFKFSQTQLDIDVERTRAFYDTHQADGETCPCAGCRNFEEARKFLPEEVRQFFQQLGVDPENPMNLTAYHSHDGNTVIYDATYHICGTALAGMNDASGNPYNFHEDTYPICEGFSVYFFNEPGLLDEAFSRPKLDLEMRFEIPWLLEEPNPYFHTIP